jgi:hypothetical protein
MVAPYQSTTARYPQPEEVAKGLFSTSPDAGWRPGSWSLCCPRKPISRRQLELSAQGTAKRVGFNADVARF